ncbi:putative T7SS-secreted protein [Actinophytocola sp.]|uniref:putative T7SS-secreted protein n=1 Tax=Actinophytocola sp. TaxID=1872138 RepID=UPI003D6A8469
MEVKELGATTVASELIPGIPDAIAFDAEATHDTSITLLDTYEAIKAVDTPGWSGDGAEAFWERFTPEAERWHEARLATLHVKRTLHDYADAVRTAQRHAEEAIAQWALADVKEAEAAAASESAQQDPNVTVSGTPPPPDPATVSAPYRDEAQAILRDAREQLARVSQETADTIAAESGTGDDAPAWLVQAAVAASQHLTEHGEASVSRTEGQFLDGSVSETEFGEQQPTANPDDAPSIRATLAEWDVSVEANLFETSADGTIELGDVRLEGSVGVTVGADAGAGITLSSDGLAANAHAGVGVRVDAEGSITIGGVEASASAEAAVGAEAEASLTLGPDGLAIEGGAFAGASVGGVAEVEVDGITVGANGELRAGIGAEGSVELSFDDGRFVIGGEVAAVLGVGGEWGWEVTVDVDELNESIVEYVNDGGIIGRFEDILNGPLR